MPNVSRLRQRRQDPVSKPYNFLKQSIVTYYPVVNLNHKPLRQVIHVSIKGCFYLHFINILTVLFLPGKKRFVKVVVIKKLLVVNGVTTKSVSRQRSG